MLHYGSRAVRYACYDHIELTKLSALYEEAFENFKQNPVKVLGDIGKKREPNAFEREYGINPIAVDLARTTPIPIAASFKCSSLEEILYLEFEKMLELDLRIKKCKNCGRYFILKGNYKTEYCGRIPDGETQTCQNIGATAKYAQKVKDNPAMALFNKAYKRYHARMKVRSVKLDSFKKWQYEAVVMREKCLNGEITAAEFEDWIDHYFENKLSQTYPVRMMPYQKGVTRTGRIAVDQVATERETFTYLVAFLSYRFMPYIKCYCSL